MPDVARRTAIEDALHDIDQRLRGVAVSPAARELRVRHGGLSRVVRAWMHVPPHDAQIAAMLECVLELRGQVLRVCASRRSSRPPPRSSSRVRASAVHTRTTRPPPLRDGSARTTRPPPARPSEPPSSSDGD